MLFSLAGCGGKKSSNGEDAKINIAFQYGLAYAPLVVAKEQGLIEKAYEEATGNKVEVTWTQMSSGPDINTSISSGDIQVGFMGVGPAVTGVMAGVGYKIFTNLSGQEHGMMTNDASLTSLDSIVGSDKQIALVNIGSIQHVILAKALYEAGLDPHALDSNLVAMKHPDGMTALQTGSVACQVTSSPYIFKEQEDEDLYEVKGVSEAWTVEDSFIVGVASESMKEDNPELYKALCEGISDAIDYINNDVEGAAQLTHEFNGNTLEEEVEYLKKGRYSTETSKVLVLGQFMGEQKFIDKTPEKYEDLVFDNVKGD